MAIKESVKIKPDEIQLSEAELLNSTIPNILQAVQMSSEKRSSLEELHGQFVKSWFKESPLRHGFLSSMQSVDFLMAYGLVGSREVGHMVMHNTALIGGEASMGDPVSITNNKVFHARRRFFGAMKHYYIENVPFDDRSGYMMRSFMVVTSGSDLDIPPRGVI